MKKETKKGIGIGAGITLGLVVSVLVMANMNTVMTVDNALDNVFPEGEKEISWQTVYIWRAIGENDPGAGTGGFMSCFLLNYTETPTVALEDNTTDWNTTGGNVSGYADYDDWSRDAVSENPFYVVVRCCFTQAQAMSGGAWNGSRTRVTLTASGDETIAAYVIWGNGTAETYGGGIESDNDSDFDKLYINFYWDDNDDGYSIDDDGSLTISEIKIEAKY